MVVKKDHWKKIALIIGIIFLLIISVIVSVKLFKKLKNSLTLQGENNAGGTGGTGTGHSGSGSGTGGNTGSSGSGSGSTGSGGTTTGSGGTTGSSGTTVPFNQLKVGDKLWSIGTTNLYKSPALGAANLALVAGDGGYVGQVKQISSGGLLKVTLYNYTGGNFGYEFYLPAKAYTVKP